jgi:hypothetical protein
MSLSTIGASLISKIIMGATEALKFANMIQTALNIPDDKIIRELSKRQTVTNTGPEEAWSLMQKTLKGE